MKIGNPGHYEDKPVDPVAHYSAISEAFGNNLIDVMQHEREMAKEQYKTNDQKAKDAFK